MTTFRCRIDVVYLKRYGRCAPYAGAQQGNQLCSSTPEPISLILALPVAYQGHAAPDLHLCPLTCARLGTQRTGNG